MLVGYARVSTGEQNLDLQMDALKQAGCEKIYHHEMSGAKAERPGLHEALAFLRKGDTLVVWRLDRLGRSLKDLVQKVEELQQRGIGFRSLHESIDTTSPVGKFQFHVFSALAEFERDLIRERTMAGLRAARARGRKGGRKPVVNWVVSKRMMKKQQMRWPKRGPHLLLQVRNQTLNDHLRETFDRWYSATPRAEISTQLAA